MNSDRRTIKKVLMIVRAFPPFQSVGHSIRAVKFLKYLPGLGWLPSVLTIDDQKEYELDRKQGSEALLRDIPAGVSIHRTIAGEPSLRFLEKERRFGERNRLTRIAVKLSGGARRWGTRNLLLPDRAIMWLPFALARGREIVRRQGIDVIFATCPPPSAAVIGACLKLLTGKRLLLDFRDDWVDTPSYHSKPAIARLIHRRMENWVVRVADRVIVVTEWSLNAFTKRYPGVSPEHFVLISNGSDLEEFASLESLPPRAGDSRFTIVHAGALTDTKPYQRSLTGLFQALQSLLREQPELSEKLVLVFAGGLPEAQKRLAHDMGVAGVIRELGHMPHAEVLHLLKSADLLLAINYESWSTIIPAKIYEYWAIGGPPILLLSCPGAAADLMTRHALGFTVEPADSDGIRRTILDVYRRSRTTDPLRVSTAGIAAYDRQALTRKLAAVLSTVT